MDFIGAKNAMKLCRLALALAMVAVPTSAIGCEYDNDEEYVFANAPVIYIGKIVAAPEARTISRLTFRSSTVKPLKAIKGILPKEQRDLSAMRSADACGPKGDGDGAFSRVGTFVFVFEGLPTAGNYPRGIQSFDIAQAEKPELLEQVSRLSEADHRK